MRVVRERDQPSVGSAPRRTRWIVGPTAGVDEDLLAGQRDLDRTAELRRRHRGEDRSGPMPSLPPKPPPMNGQTMRILLLRQLQRRGDAVATVDRQLVAP